MTMQENRDYLSQRYEFIELAGSGGEGRVWKAYDHAIERMVAIKELPSSPAHRKEALKEARAVARLQHPNIITLYDVIEEDKVYLVLEYVEGISLRDVLNQIGRLDSDLAIAIFIQTAKAIEYAHNHEILHLDIKPENILIIPEGKVKIADFGLARFTFEDSEEGTIKGTIPYCAPEILKGRYSEKADIYSLGVVFYEMLTGENPFYSPTTRGTIAKIKDYKPEPPSVFNSNIPLELDSIVLKSLEKSPIRRYENVVKFRIKAERYFKGASPEGEVASIFEVTEKAKARIFPRLRLPVKVSEKAISAMSAGLFFLACSFSLKIDAFQSLSLATIAASSAALAFFAPLPGAILALFSISLIAFTRDFDVGLVGFLLSALIYASLRFLSRVGIQGFLFAPASLLGLEPLLAAYFPSRMSLFDLLSFLVSGIGGLLIFFSISAPDSALSTIFSSISFLSEISQPSSASRFNALQILSSSFFLLETSIIVVISFASWLFIKFFRQASIMPLLVLIATSFVISFISTEFLMPGDVVDVLQKKMAISIFALASILFIRWATRFYEKKEADGSHII